MTAIFCAECRLPIKHTHVFDFMGTTDTFRAHNEFNLKDCGITDKGIVCRECFEYSLQRVF
jgi:hypothetical protein